MGNVGSKSCQKAPRTPYSHSWGVVSGPFGSSVRGDQCRLPTHRDPAPQAPALRTDPASWWDGHPARLPAEPPPCEAISQVPSSTAGPTAAPAAHPQANTLPHSQTDPQTGVQTDDTHSHIQMACPARPGDPLRRSPGHGPVPPAGGQTHRLGRRCQRSVRQRRRDQWRRCRCRGVA